MFDVSDSVLCVQNVPCFKYIIIKSFLCVCRMCDVSDILYPLCVCIMCGVPDNNSNNNNILY